MLFLPTIENHKKALRQTGRIKQRDLRYQAIVGAVFR
jgi:hypothetical protein